MSSFARFAINLLMSVLAFIVMVILAVVAFYITVFVVSTGASLAGFEPSGEFVVLAASLLVVAAIIAGGLSPAAMVFRSQHE